MAAKVSLSSKLWSVKKKDMATIFKNFAWHRISVEQYGLVPRWFDAEHQFWKLWPCLFSSSPHNFDDKLTFAAMTLSCNNLANNHSDPHVSHIFGKLSPCSFTWSYPGRIFLHKIFEEKQKKQKIPIFAFLEGLPKKYFKRPPIGQFWCQRASQYLIWKLMPQIFQETC